MKTRANDGDIPPEFATALKAAGLENFFADCTPSHRREYLKWIGEAKKSETRTARSLQVVKRLASKQAQEENPRRVLPKS